MIGLRSLSEIFKITIEPGTTRFQLGDSLDSPVSYRSTVLEEHRTVKNYTIVGIRQVQNYNFNLNGCAQPSSWSMEARESGR